MVNPADFPTLPSKTATADQPAPRGKKQQPKKTDPKITQVAQQNFSEELTPVQSQIRKMPTFRDVLMDELPPPAFLIEQPPFSFAEADANQILQEFKEKSSDLSFPTQAEYEALLQEQQQLIAGFQSLFSSTNRKYIAAAGKGQMEREDMRKMFRELREKEKEKYQEICTSYSSFKQIFLERIKALQIAIEQQTFESVLLTEAIKGNDSCYNSVYFFGEGRYGAIFRLATLVQALEDRRAAIGIKKEGLASDASNIMKIPSSSKICQQLATMSSDIEILKEKIMIYNAALNKVCGTIVNSDLPQKYYLFHKQQWDTIKASFSNLNEEINHRLVELEQKINLESSTPDSSQSLAYKQEKEELKMRREKMDSRQKEIEELLNPRKTSDIKESLQLADLSLSTECHQALDLLARITALAKEVMLSNNWERFAPLEQRCSIYSQLSEKAENLKKEKDEFQTQILPKRLESINTAVNTYQSYIVNIQESMRTIDSHFQSLAKDAQERANWQVAPLSPKMDSPTTPTTERKATGLFGWWGSV